MDFYNDNDYKIKKVVKNMYVLKRYFKKCMYEIPIQQILDLKIYKICSVFIQVDADRLQNKKTVYVLVHWSSC